jgi:hypothetical protein
MIDLENIQVMVIELHAYDTDPRRIQARLNRMRLYEARTTYGDNVYVCEVAVSENEIDDMTVKVEDFVRVRARRAFENMIARIKSAT